MNYDSSGSGIDCPEGSSTVSALVMLMKLVLDVVPHSDCGSRNQLFIIPQVLVHSMLFKLAW